MPIYEYQCGSCGHELEVIQKMSDRPLTDCPDCRDPALRRKISAAGFRLKGGGWYETDFKQSGKRNLAGDKRADSAGDGGGKKASSDSPAATSGDSGKSDSKPAARTGND